MPIPLQYRSNFYWLNTLLIHGAFCCGIMQTGQTSIQILQQRSLAVAMPLRRTLPVFLRCLFGESMAAYNTRSGLLVHTGYRKPRHSCWSTCLILEWTCNLRLKRHGAEYLSRLVVLRQSRRLGCYYPSSLASLHPFARNWKSEATFYNWKMNGQRGLGGCKVLEWTQQPRHSVVEPILAEMVM